MQYVPIVEPPRLLSLWSLLALVWLIAWAVGVTVLTINFPEGIFLPISAVFIPIAVWLGAGRGWTGVRMLIVAAAFFAFTRLGINAFEWDQGSFQQEILGLVILAASIFTAVADWGVSFFASERVPRPTTPQLILIGIGLGMMVPALLETYMPPINLWYLLWMDKGTQEVVINMGMVIAAPSVPLLMRKHGQLKRRWQGLFIAMIVATVAMFFIVLRAERWQEALTALWGSPMLQIIVASIIYPLDYVLRACGWSLIDIPRIPSAEVEKSD